VWQSAGYLGTIFLIQSQNIAACALLGGLTWLLAGSAGGRWVSFALWLTIALLTLIDQVYYKVFLDHVHLSLFEGGHGFNPALMVGSFFQEMDAVFLAAGLVALFAGVWLLRTIAAATPETGTLSGSERFILATAALLFVSGLPAVFSSKYFHLNENPVVSFVRDWSRRNLDQELSARARPLAGETAEMAPLSTADRDPRLVAIANARHDKPGRPNLILIVMESTGAAQLLNSRGLPSPAVTPNLLSMSQRAVLFDQIYAPIPASTRSLISIHTGGRYPTIGGATELSKIFTGPTLPGEFGRRGYATALFSSQRLDGEYSDVFLGHIGFGTVYDFANDLAAHLPQFYIHSWGAQELYTVGLMERWIEQQDRAGAPYFMVYYTAATHHPYGAPKGFRTPLPPGDSQANYLNALYYTDYSIGQLIAFLSLQKDLDHTVVAVTGDHGEAFGDLHPLNRLHREYIYEENVREFLLLFDPSAIAEAVVSHRTAGNGDIMPTLLRYLNSGVNGGKTSEGAEDGDLLAADFTEAPVFFHKLAAPEQWGLRDGRWKYIGDIRSGAAELFDLATDPTEQKNIAAAWPARINRYRELCRQWMVTQNDEYKSHLKDR
jgi:arylsulfatase A-like enzyme